MKIGDLVTFTWIRHHSRGDKSVHHGEGILVGFTKRGNAQVRVKTPIGERITTKDAKTLKVKE